ncbi:patatin-like phospholipase family protein [Mesorhizobium yinganensis]|uniref:patatin-like phospholipase family protein n=1 Tax=Mesorhizobium yinganensis TaxID=3157707 RepID=UPI0032B86567
MADPANPTRFYTENFDDVRAAENEAIWRRRLQRRKDAAAEAARLRNEQPPNLFGVALSGGGIRSASFCLGALQALDQQGLIARADYLSTVSGGGYIGAGMVAAMNRRPGIFPFTASAAGSGDVRDSEPVTHLRDYSRFLAPKGTRDLLTSLTVILRGLMVNFLLVMSVFLVVATLAILMNPTTDYLDHNVLYDITIYLCGCDLKEGQWRQVAARLLRDPFIVSKALAVFLALWLTGWALWRSYVEAYKRRYSQRIFEPGSKGTRFGFALAFALVVSLVLEAQPVIIGKIIEFATRDSANYSSLQALGTAAAAVVAATAAFRDRLISLIQKALGSATFGARVQAALARTAFLALGLALPILLYSVLLLVVVWGLDIVSLPGMPHGYLYAPQFFVSADSRFLAIELGILALFVAVRTVAVVRAGRMLALLRGGMAVVAGLGGWRTWLRILGVIVAIGVLTTFLVYAAIATRKGEPIDSAHWTVLFNYLALSALVITVSYNFTENANGLHRLYRDRLSVAFRMGKVDNEEPLRLHEINDSAPYLLVNAALNVRRGLDETKKRTPDGRAMPVSEAAIGPGATPRPDPAKRGRNAEFFLFSRDYVGSDATGYAGSRLLGKFEPQLDLATAAAISGAAVSSSMGRIGIGLLGPTLALLNLRLGFWLVNPRNLSPLREKRRWHELLRLYLFNEAFGRLDAQSARIYVTDGGHIDNIGLYQLLKRRCKFIVIVDAEADPAMNFGAFCDVQRFARIDEGVRISLDWWPVRDAAIERQRDKTKQVPKDADAHNQHFAIGRILYEKDGSETVEGVLVYVKATVTGDEPDYILDYERRYPMFPHESTGDQFFSEEQMEAYRALGFHAMMRALINKRQPFASPLGKSESVVDRMRRDLLS